MRKRERREGGRRKEGERVGENDNENEYTEIEKHQEGVSRGKGEGSNSYIKQLSLGVITCH